jgi:hypothetical protein
MGVDISSVIDALEKRLRSDGCDFVWERHSSDYAVIGVAHKKGEYAYFTAAMLGRNCDFYRFSGDTEKRIMQIYNLGKYESHGDLDRSVQLAAVCDTLRALAPLPTAPFPS